MSTQGTWCPVQSCPFLQETSTVHMNVLIKWLGKKYPHSSKTKYLGAYQTFYLFKNIFQIVFVVFSMRKFCYLRAQPLHLLEYSSLLSRLVIWHTSIAFTRGIPFLPSNPRTHFFRAVGLKIQSSNVVERIYIAWWSPQGQNPASMPFCLPSPKESQPSKAKALGAWSGSILKARSPLKMS